MKALAWREEEAGTENDRGSIGTAMFLLDLDSVVNVEDRETPAFRSLRRSLARLHAVSGGGLVIASGSRLPAWRAMFRGVAAHLVGEHGWEEQDADGWTVRHPVPTRTARRLQAAQRAAESRGWGRYLESRRASVRLRPIEGTDDSAPIRGVLCRRLWSPAFECEGLRVHTDAVAVELRAIERTPLRITQERAIRASRNGALVHFGCGSSGPALPIAAVGGPSMPPVDARFASPAELEEAVGAWIAGVPPGSRGSLTPH